jgi:pyruvate dehydrogenase E1 component alpha subunit
MCVSLRNLALKTRYPSSRAGVAAAEVDGMDVNAVEAATRTAIERVRGSGPYLLECRAYRFRAHSMYDPELYRSKEEVEHWKQRCTIAKLREGLRSHRAFSEATSSDIEASISEEIFEAVAFAEAGPLEPVEDLLKDVLTESKERI